MSGEAKFARLGFVIETEVLRRAKQEATGLKDSLLGVAEAADKANAKLDGTNKAVKESAEATVKETQATVQNTEAKVRARDAKGRFVKTTEESTEALKKEADALKKVEDAATRIPKVQKEAAEATEKHRGAIAALLERFALFGTLAPGAVDHLFNLAHAGQDASNALGSSTGLAGKVQQFSQWLAGSVSGMGTFTAGLLGTGAAVGALAAGYTVLTAATYQAQEQQRSLEIRLRNVFGSATAAVDVMQRLRTMANDNGMMFDTTAESFLRMSRNNESMGLSRGQLVDLTATLQKLGTISGAGQGEIASGMMQFSQALSAGKLSGDELHAIMENLPELAKQIAIGLGVSVGQLKAMGAEGQLTSDKIVNALLGRMPEINKEFETLGNSSQNAFARVENNWNRMLANMGEAMKSSEAVQFFENAKAGFYGFVADSLASAGSDPQRRIAELQSQLGMTQTAQPNPTVTADSTIGEKSGFHFGQALSIIGQAFGLSTNTDVAEGRAADLRGEIDPRRLELAALMEDRRAAKEAAMMDGGDYRTMQRSSFVRAQPVLQDLDKLASQRKELQSTVDTLELALADFEEAKAANRLDIYSQEELDRLEKVPALLETVKTRLGEIRSPIENYRAETNRIGFNADSPGGLSMLNEARGLVMSSAAAGDDLTMEQARADVMDRRVATTSQQTAALERQIEQQQVMFSNLRAGEKAQREAEIAAEAYNYQIETFGTTLGPDAAAAMEKYTDGLRALKEAQALVTAEQKLMNEEMRAAELAARAAGIAAGENAGQIEERVRIAKLEAEIARINGGATAGAVAGGAASVSSMSAPASPPAGMQAMFEAASRATGIPVALLAGVAHTESRFNPNAVSPTGALGVMQILPSTARDPGYGVTPVAQEQLLDPATNIMFGAQYLAARARAGGVTDLTDPGQMAGALRAYNGPIGAGGDPDYVSKVFAASGTPIPAGPVGTPPPGYGTPAGSVMWTGGPSPESVNIEAANLGFDNDSMDARLRDEQRYNDLVKERETLEAQIGASREDQARIQREAAAREFAATATPDMQEKLYNEKLAELEAQDAKAAADRLQTMQETTEETRRQAEIASLPRREREIELAVLKEINEELRAGRTVDAGREAQIRQSVTEGWEAGDMLDRETERAASVQNIWDTAAQGIGNGLRTALRQAAKEGKVDVESIVSDLLIDIADAILQAFVTKPLTDAISQGLSSWGAGLGIQAPTVPPPAPMAGAHGLVMMAHGGLLAGPTLMPLPSSPTRMALGGEAGVEAIMPLQRGPDGRLGVAARGGSDGGINVVVNDMRSASGSQPVEMEESTGPDGRRQLQIAIRDETRRQLRTGELDTAMSDSFGARRPLTRR